MFLEGTIDSIIVVVVIIIIIIVVVVVVVVVVVIYEGSTIFNNAIIREGRDECTTRPSITYLYVTHITISYIYFFIKQY